MYYLNDDSWGDGQWPYDTVEDFLEMCQDCFGTEPDLIEYSTGDYYDRESGRLVLERRES